MWKSQECLTLRVSQEALETRCLPNSTFCTVSIPFISRRDEKWTNEFFQSLFPDINKPLHQLNPQEFIQGLLRFEQSIPQDPGHREFGGLKRDADGKFNDAEMVNVMKESMEDPAGLFGARIVPKALRMIEIAGILTSRKWILASLNEMRSFFGLRRHDVTTLSRTSTLTLRSRICFASCTITPTWSKCIRVCSSKMPNLAWIQVNRIPYFSLSIFANP